MRIGAPCVIWVVGLAVIVTAMAGTVVRMRRSSGELRQQLRWLAFAAALTAVAMVGLVGAYAVGLNPPNMAFDAILVLGYGVAVPVGCGIAILKHGLYELDVVISKTVVYGLLAAFFTAIYVAVVVGVGAAFASTRNPFHTVAAAALLARAFKPDRDPARR